MFKKNRIYFLLEIVIALVVVICFACLRISYGIDFSMSLFKLLFFFMWALAVPAFIIILIKYEKLIQYPGNQQLFFISLFFFSGVITMIYLFLFFGNMRQILKGSIENWITYFAVVLQVIAWIPALITTILNLISIVLYEVKKKYYILNIMTAVLASIIIGNFAGGFMK